MQSQRFSFSSLISRRVLDFSPGEVDLFQQGLTCRRILEESDDDADNVLIKSEFLEAWTTLSQRLCSKPSTEFEEELFADLSCACMQYEVGWWDVNCCTKIFFTDAWVGIPLQGGKYPPGYVDDICQSMEETLRAGECSSEADELSGRMTPQPFPTSEPTKLPTPWPTSAPALRPTSQAIPRSTGLPTRLQEDSAAAGSVEPVGFSSQSPTPAGDGEDDDSGFLALDRLKRLGEGLLLALFTFFLVFSCGLLCAWFTVEEEDEGDDDEGKEAKANENAEASRDSGVHDAVSSPVESLEHSRTYGQGGSGFAKELETTEKTLSDGQGNSPSSFSSSEEKQSTKLRTNHDTETLEPTSCLGRDLDSPTDSNRSTDTNTTLSRADDSILVKGTCVDMVVDTPAVDAGIEVQEGLSDCAVPSNTVKSASSSKKTGNEATEIFFV